MLVIVAGVVPWRPTPTAAVLVHVPELPELGHDGRFAWQAMMAAPAAGLAFSGALALAAPALANRALPTSAVAASKVMIFFKTDPPCSTDPATPIRRRRLARRTPVWGVLVA